MRFFKSILFSITLFVASALPTLAQILPDPPAGFGTRDLREAAMAIVNILLGFVGIIAVIVILWGGFQWMVSLGNEEKLGKAKRTLSGGVIGLIIIFSSYAIAAFVINNLAAATGAQ